MSARIECDHCGLKVRIRPDGTYPPHEYSSSRINSRGRTIPGTRQRVECEKTGKPYAFHMGTFRVIERDAYGLGTKWLASCRCGLSWTGADHDEAAGPWEEHAKTAKPEVSG